MQLITPRDLVMLSPEKTLELLNTSLVDAVADNWVQRERQTDFITLNLLAATPLSVAMFQHKEYLTEKFLDAGWTKVEIGHSELEGNVCIKLSSNPLEKSEENNRSFELINTNDQRWVRSLKGLQEILVLSELDLYSINYLEKGASYKNYGPTGGYTITRLH